MGKKDEAKVDALLNRVRQVCYGFAGTEEKLSHGMPSFHVRGKMFVHFVDNHHDDGELAIWCKATFERQRSLVSAYPDRYFVPPYVGVRGWVAARLDRPATDWVELAIVIEEGWLSVAPPKLARGEGAPPRPPPAPPRRPTTDVDVAREALDRLTTICLAYPDAARDKQGKHATFAVGGKAFVSFLDNHHGDERVIGCVRGDRDDNESLVKRHPKRYCSPAYIGKRGWLGIRLEPGHVDWKDVEARVRASYESVAPKRRAPSPKTAKSAKASSKTKLATKKTVPSKKKRAR